MINKYCPVCKTEHPITHFHKCAKASDGVQFRCKDCDKKYHHERYLRDKEKISVQTKKWKEENKEKASQAGKEWAKQNPDKIKTYQRTSNLRKNFGLEIHEYEQMLKAQGGVCAICEQPETFIHKATGKPARLAVDHCHVKGSVRKLLCKSCNNGLGLFKDNPELLKKAADYLRNHNGT